MEMELPLSKFRTEDFTPVPTGQLFQGKGWKLVLSVNDLRPVYKQMKHASTHEREWLWNSCVYLIEQYSVVNCVEFR